MNNESKLARSSGLMGIATVISRILGLVRDTLIGHLLGARWISDAYYVAYRIPNVLRQLLGEGALSSAFIPVFCRLQIEKGKDDAFCLARATLFWLYAILMLITICGMLFSPWLIKLFTLGSDQGQEFIPVAVELVRIMFPFFIFIGLAAIIMAILNSMDYFFLPALAPASFNIVLIITAFAAPWFTSHPVARVKILAMGVLVGGACQFLVMVPTLLREGMPFRIATRHPGLKKIMTMMIPATIGQSVVQISLVVNTMIGWLIGEGAITALNYGNRLMNFPLGVLGVSIAQTAVPTLSRQVAVGDPGELKKTLTYLFRVTIFVMIPASAGLMALSQPIIRLLFQHGEFDVLATLKTSGCLYWFATGLVFYTLVKILAPIFYAFEDTRTPVVVAIISMIFNIIVNLLLMDSMKESGLALSTALTSCLNVTLLLWFLRKRIGLLGLRAIIPTFFKVVLIATVMGISVSKVAAYFEPAATVALRVTQVGVGLTTGVVIYSLLAWLIRLEEFNDSIVYVKKRLAR